MSGIFVDKEKVWSSMFTSTVNRQVTSSQASQVARFGSVTSCRILGLFICFLVPEVAERFATKC